MISGIYLYYFKGSDDIEKSYVGSTTDFKKRHKSHIYELRTNRHRNGRLQNAFNKYGEINLVYEQLEIMVFPEDYEISIKRAYLESREHYWEEKLKCRYNIRKPGFWTKVSDKIELSKQFIATKKPVYQIDKNLNIIRRYSSVKEASVDLELAPIAISRVARLLQGSTSGYYFRYENFLNVIFEPTGKERKSLRKKIICYDNNGVFLKEYPSIMQAAKELYITESCISASCKNANKRASNFIFRFENSDLLIKPISLTGAIKPVLCFKDNLFYGEYENVRVAAKVLNIDRSFIKRRCLNLPQSKYMDYNFQYK